MKKLFLIFLAFTSIVFAKEVTVSILPQKYFVEKIAGDKISVNVMVKPGYEPEIYEPTMSQMKKLVKSEVYFLIGFPFENIWLKKFKSANKNLLIVDTSKGIKKIPMQEHSHHHGHHGEKHEEHAKHEGQHGDHESHHDEEDEGHEGHHGEKHEEHAKHEGHHGDHESHHDEEDEGHGGHHGDHHGEVLDPHIWLDPLLVKIQAKTIYKTLVKIDGANKEFYKNNYENFIKDLDQLYLKLKTTLKPVKNKPFMIFHPAWGYFAKRFHLEQIAVEVEGKEPKPKQLVKLIDKAKKHNIKVVFIAPQFSKKSAEFIAKSINGITSVGDPLATNWEENMLTFSNKIVESYK